MNFRPQQLAFTIAPLLLAACAARVPVAAPKTQDCAEVPEAYSAIGPAAFESALGGWWDEGPAKEADALCTPGRNLHRIVFSKTGDAEVRWVFEGPYTKTSGETVESYGYTVLGASSVVLTLEMHGEDRKPDGGERMLWELIWTGDGSYTWRAAHWDKLGYAPMIGRRCSK